MGRKTERELLAIPTTDEMSSITDIYILNRSTLVSDDDAAKAVAAVNVQVNRDFAPVWFLAADVKFRHAHKGEVPEHNRVIVIVDNAADYDGMHTLTQRDKPFGIVAVQPELDAGTQWTVCLSHEVLEMLGDSWLGISALRDRRMYAVEVCDPVESDTCAYKIDGVLVSDFITPRWFEFTQSGPFSFNNSCTHPFHILPGGYMESRYFAKVPKSALRTATGGTTNKRPIGSRRHRRAG